MKLVEKRIWIIYLVKTFVIIASFLIAFLLRFDLTIPQNYWLNISVLLLPLVLIKLVVFSKMGLNHGWWRYVSMADVLDILKANSVGSALFIIYLYFVHGMPWVPRSVLVLDGGVCFLMICGVRFITRAYRENYFTVSGRDKKGLTQVLIYGAGDAGQMIVREARQNPEINMHIIGFIDDNPSKSKMKFQGVTVLGGRNKIEQLLGETFIDEVIIAIPSASAEEIRSIYDLCRGYNLNVKTLPGVNEILSGKVSINAIRDVSFDDLLGRKPVRLDIPLIRSNLQDKRVLVTGAAGSIGSEICRQVARFNPKQLVLVDNAETPLFNIERELSDNFPNISLFAILGDVRDQRRVTGVFEEFMPHIIFHAAAYKHVPMMEYNPAESVINNVFGTRKLADAAHAIGVERFVMISTDKAVNPANVMGATKRAAELYIQGMSQHSKTQFITVRFGNVLGSAGSVIPIFKEQIAKGGPVKVTHPDITRYFMTIPEASQLVLQAGSMGRGGEIFLLDMGNPVKIVDLAEELIRMSGLIPHKDIKIVFTGLRPGEKLYEELLATGENLRPTIHDKICVASLAGIDWQELNEKLEELYQSAREIDLEKVCTLLREIVPEYTTANNRYPRINRVPKPEKNLHLVQ